MIDENTLYHFRRITLPVKTWNDYRGAEETGEALGYIKEETSDLDYEERYYFRHHGSDDWHEIILDDVRSARHAEKADIARFTQNH